jgi:hypothetical protein
MNNRALVYSSQRRLSDAEEMYKLVLADYEESLGLGHLSAHETVLNLRNLYRDQGRIEDAEKLDNHQPGNPRVIDVDEMSFDDSLEGMYFDYIQNLL